MNKVKISLIVLLLLSSTISASEVGFIQDLTGTVKIKRLKKTLLGSKQDKIYSGDIVITKINSTVSIVLTSGELITLEEKSVLPINKHLHKKANSSKHLTMTL